ncbi:hypothetical protein CK203_016086 [Vitis vinifera]|uniref:Uncharacterized protein n=1 Tax=Vitis vinifera TaxID=29760 RepID=A0A438EHE5_VITVI|nr:hypothetical protein CK203_107456 [Vitis vinifera]RVX10284.1 hypothetical protein CK203_016086 [Vitis vinifera]
MRGLADNLNSIGQVITDEDSFLYILARFGPKYESIVVNLTSRNDCLTLQEFRSRGGRGRTCPNNGGFGHANKPIFQIYGKIGHVAAKCYGRFDISFLGIDSINSVSSSRQTNVVFTSNSTYHEWYDDSCATNHVTIDMNNLNIKANYMGNEKLMDKASKKILVEEALRNGLYQLDLP